MFTRLNKRGATTVASAILLLIVVGIIPAAVAGPSGDPPCAFGPTGCAPPKIHLTGAPKTCTVKDFRLHVRIEHAVSLARVRVRLDHKALKRTKRKSFSVKVPARGLRPGDHRLRVTAVDRYGVQAVRRLRVSRCDPNPQVVSNAG